MKKIAWIAFVLLAFVSSLPAQNRVDTKWHCTKPSEFHRVAVGAAPNHNYTIIQGSCRSMASNAQFPEKECSYTEFQELQDAFVRVHGSMNATMENGDKVFYSYEGSFPADTTKPFSQRWKLVNGTGRYQSIMGNGICTGLVHADGTGDMECSGKYSTGKRIVD